MSTEFKLPDLGENVEEGDVVSVLVSEGDTITADQPVLELETGKATLEIPCPHAGDVTSVNVKEGDKVSVGQVILTVESNGASPDASKPEKKAEEKEPETSEDEPVPDEAGEAEQEAEEESTGETGTTEIKLPELGENIEEGDIVNVLVSEGDTVEIDQALVEIETGKATIEVPSTAAGKVTSIAVKEGDKAKVGQTVATIEGGKAPSSKKKSEPKKKDAEKAESKPEPKKQEQKADAPAPKPQAAARPAAGTSRKKVVAAPSVRKFAREIGLAIEDVPGTGPKGRVSTNDVKAYAKQLNEGRAVGGAAAPAAPLPDFSRYGETEAEDMNNVRKMTVEHMTRCWTQIPHVTQHDKADITELERLRKKYGKKAEEAGGKLTITAILIKIMGNALKEFPNFNASIDTANNRVIYKKYFNVGCAVDTPKGLVVPVIRNVDGKDIVAISVELGEIAKKARDGKITPNDMQGGCITLSNLGGLGGKHFAPIVNFPEVAIIGLGRAQKEPVFIDGMFQPRLLCPVSISYDHRLIDGADGTRFLRWVCEALEEPFFMNL